MTLGTKYTYFCLEIVRHDYGFVFPQTTMYPMVERTGLDLGLGLLSNKQKVSDTSINTKRLFLTVNEWIDVYRNVQA